MTELEAELPITGRTVVSVTGDYDDVTLRFDDGSQLSFASSQTHGWTYTAPQVLRSLRSTAASRESDLEREMAQIMTGGNHLGSALIGLLGAPALDMFPPYSVSLEEARAVIADVDVYDAWVCWKTIMLARDALSLPTPRVLKDDNARSKACPENRITIAELAAWAKECPFTGVPTVSPADIHRLIAEVRLLRDREWLRAVYGGEV